MTFAFSSLRRSLSALIASSKVRVPSGACSGACFMMALMSSLCSSKRLNASSIFFSSSPRSGSPRFVDLETGVFVFIGSVDRGQDSIELRFIARQIRLGGARLFVGCHESTH